MKKRLLLLIIPGLMFSQTACNKFTEGYDVSPNNPSQATLPLLLSASELQTINIYGGQVARISNIFTQHLAGTDQQYATYADYVINETDTDNDFQSIYQGGLINAQLAIDKGTAEGSPYYVGIAKINKAILLGIATDVFGDVPNRQALQGIRELSPAYDPQEIVIQDIQTLLSEGIAELQKPATSNRIRPAQDDLIHNGDVSAWIRTAYILKARYANRLSKRNPAGSATEALRFLDQGYAAGLNGNDDDANAIYGTNAANQNQFYAFQNARGGYVKMGARLVNLLTSLNDPRLQVYAATDDAGGYSGTPLGSDDTRTSDIGAFYASPDAPIPMVTYVEAKFIEAEAALRLGNTMRAQTAYSDAVTAHFNKLGLASQLTAYLAANGTLPTASAAALERIMTQKYIANFLQIEAWSDYRRTKLPALVRDPDATISRIPERLPTPQSERVNNRNATVVQDLTQPVWWAQ